MRILLLVFVLGLIGCGVEAEAVRTIYVPVDETPEEVENKEAVKENYAPETDLAEVETTEEVECNSFSSYIEANEWYPIGFYEINEQCFSNDGLSVISNYIHLYDDGYKVEQINIWEYQIVILDGKETKCLKYRQYPEWTNLYDSEGNTLMDDYGPVFAKSIIETFYGSDCKEVEKIITEVN